MSLDAQEFINALRAGDFTHANECFAYVMGKLPKKTQKMDIGGVVQEVPREAAVDEFLPALTFEFYCTDLNKRDILLVNFLVNAVLYNPVLYASENSACLTTICTAIGVALTMKSVHRSPKTITHFKQSDYYNDNDQKDAFLKEQDRCRKLKKEEISDKIFAEISEATRKLIRKDKLIANACKVIEKKVEQLVEELAQIELEEDQERNIIKQKSEESFTLLNEYVAYLEKSKFDSYEPLKSLSFYEDFRNASNKVRELSEAYKSIPQSGLSVNQIKEIHDAIDACKQFESELQIIIQDNLENELPELQSSAQDAQQNKSQEVQSDLEETVGVEPEIRLEEEIVLEPEHESSDENDQQKESLKVESDLEEKKSSAQDGSTSSKVKVSSFAGSMFPAKSSQTNAASNSSTEVISQNTYNSLKRYAKHLDKEERTLGRNAEIKTARELVIRLSSQYHSIPKSGFSEQEIKEINSAIGTCLSIEKSIREKALLKLMNDYANHLDNKLNRVRKINPDSNNEYFKKLQQRYDAIVPLAKNIGEYPPENGLDQEQISEIKNALAECKRNVPTYRERFDVKRLTDIMSFLSDILSLGIKPLYRTITSSEKKYKEELTQSINKLGP